MHNDQTAKKWIHFKDFNSLKSLIDFKENIFLMGPPKSGKTQLINDLLKNKKHIIKMNCLMFTSLNKLRSQIVQEIYKMISCDNEELKMYRTFNQLENYVSNVTMMIEKKDIILIIENTESVYKYVKNSDMKKFFEKNRLHFMNINTISGMELGIQTIVISTLKIPVINFSFYQFVLPFPDENTLANHMAEYLNNKLNKDSGDVNNQIIVNFFKRENFKNEFLADVNCFNAFIRDFWTFEILLNKLYFTIKHTLENSKNIDNIKNISNIKNYLKTKELIEEDFSYVFKQNEELVEAFSTFKEKKDLQTIVSNLDPHNDLVNDLPLMPKVLLAAFGVTSENPKSHDYGIFMKITERNKNKNIPNKKNKQKNLNVNLSRVIAICEIFLERIKFRKITLDNERIYHSIDFFLNIDFLEKIKLIKFINLKNNEYLYKYLGNMDLTAKILESLGLKPTEFMNYI